MIKTPKEMTSDILSSLGKKDAPEGILLEMYLERVIQSLCKKAVDDYINDQLSKPEIEYKPSHG